MKSAFLVILTCILFTSCSRNLVIHVTDGNVPVEDVRFSIDYHKPDAMSNAKGYATIHNVRRKETIEVSKDGFKRDYLGRYAQRHYKHHDTIDVVLTPVYDPVLAAMWKAEDSVNRIKWALEDAAYPPVADQIITLADTFALFPGGTDVMKQWLNKHMNYPIYSIENEESGRVFVSFIVEADGNVTNVRIMRGVSYHIDRESLRVCREMPDWKPGYKKGSIVRTRFNLPLSYILQ